MAVSFFGLYMKKAKEILKEIAVLNQRLNSLADCSQEAVSVIQRRVT
jgi:hypothetical protein